MRLILHNPSIYKHFFLEFSILTNSFHLFQRYLPWLGAVIIYQPFIYQISNHRIVCYFPFFFFSEVFLSLLLFQKISLEKFSWSLSEVNPQYVKLSLLKKKYLSMNLYLVK